ncbi:MAG: ribokinase [Woeseiaceae bacterium]
MSRTEPAMPGRNPTIVVVGSVNLDLVAMVPRLPTPGETVTGAELGRYPGGKGANQALAARRLGADVMLHARVGADANAEEALALLRADGVNLSDCSVDPDAPTGVALISVAPSGENQIVVAPGANRTLRPEMLDLPWGDALICQLEVPAETIRKAGEDFDGFFCVNLAPAMPVPSEILKRADLIVVNETEAAFYGDLLNENEALVAVTHGAKGAHLQMGGKELASARPPAVEAVDATGAGDTFTAALTVALVEKQPHQDALAFACAAGACATTKQGAQPSFPYRQDVEKILR